MAPPVRCEGVTKTYPDGDREVVAVRDVHWSLEAGGLVALAGPSGCGKTTLLAMLGGMVQPTRGSIELFGRPIAHLRDAHRAELRRRTVGFVFQGLALLPELTVEENLFLPVVPEGGPTRTQRARTLERLERLGLAPRLRTPAQRLSGGERQRVALIRALVHEPPLLLLDEPTAHLDAHGAEQVLAALATLTNADGRSVIVATHDPRVLEHASVRQIARMRDGVLDARL